MSNKKYGRKYIKQYLVNNNNNNNIINVNNINTVKMNSGSTF